MLATDTNSWQRGSNWLGTCVLGAVMLATLIAAGCGGAMRNVNWTNISQQDECEALVPAMCLGLYGFTIDRSGNFVAGPSPSGKSVQGAITPQELSRLTELSDAFLNSASQTLHCEHPSPPLSPGSGFQIQISADNGLRFDVWDVGTGGICTMGDQTRAAALRDYAKQLLAKYYPSPFPG